MKAGDLIKVVGGMSPSGETRTCPEDCFCFFCAHNSSRIGIVIERLNEEGVKHSSGYWSVMFDVGEWRVYGTEAEVISESR